MAIRSLKNTFHFQSLLNTTLRLISVLICSVVLSAAQITSIEIAHSDIKKLTFLLISPYLTSSGSRSDLFNSHRLREKASMT